MEQDWEPSTQSQKLHAINIRVCREITVAINFLEMGKSKNYVEKTFCSYKILETTNKVNIVAQKC